MDRFALIVAVISAIVWGIVGVFGYNPVHLLASGNMTAIARAIYILFALGGIWCIKFLFRQRLIIKDHD
jgi:uncharacterized protein